MLACPAGEQTVDSRVWACSLRGKSEARHLTINPMLEMLFYSDPLQNRRDAFTSTASSLEPREDLHDYAIFADRPRASEAGDPSRLLRPFLST